MPTYVLAQSDTKDFGCLSRGTAPFFPITVTEACKIDPGCPPLGRSIPPRPPAS